jgi:autotransporter-associated beta strand protein
MPGTKDTVYINLHAASGVRSRLTFDYDGPVTLGAPIGGGKYHDTLAAPGAGDIVIAGTRGNDVTFAAPQYYDGSTTVEKGAVLRLGSGKPGGDGGLLTGTEGGGSSTTGPLSCGNVSLPTKLSHSGGKGSLVQSGAATTTLTGTAVTYTGTTTVSKGTLALRSGQLSPTARRFGSPRRARGWTWGRRACGWRHAHRLGHGEGLGDERGRGDDRPHRDRRTTRRARRANWSWAPSR